MTASATARTRFRLPPLTPFAALLEIGLLVLVGLFAASTYLNLDPEQRLAGFEMEYTTAVGNTISETFRTQGFIPYWQSFTAFGDPAIDSWLSYTLNPLAMGPSFLLGQVNGLKIGIVISVLVAGLGGWALGRVLGLNWLGRVLLGALCIGKGNMYAMIDVGGYYQFVANQSYFAWIGAGIVSLFWLPHRRWPVVLLPVSIMLLFFSGMVWFMLPTLFVMGIMALLHLFYVRVWRKNEQGQLNEERVLIDWPNTRRLIWAGILTLGLCMATFLPLWVNRDTAPRQKLAGNEFLGLDVIVDQFVNPSLGAYYTVLSPVVRTEAYNFVTPLWYLGLLAVLMLPLLALYRNAPPKLWRVYLAAWGIVIFFVLWTAGLNPILDLMEQFIPLIGQFRHQWRTLSVASVWLAAILAIHASALWEVFVKSGQWQARLPALLRGRALRLAFALLLISTSSVAAYTMVERWKSVKGIQAETVDEDTCVRWLRSAYPDRHLSMCSGRYINVTSYLQNRVRHWQIFTDFFPITPQAATLLPQANLTTELPEFGLAFGGETPVTESLGYVEPIDQGINCPQGLIARKKDALDYAFSVPLDELAKHTADLPAAVTTPIRALEHHQDRLALYVDADPSRSLVVTVQEAAYPGWMVEVNGSPAKLESVGGQIGVVIPPGTGRTYVYFQYTAPLFMAGARVTLFFCILTILFTLRIERVIPKRLRESIIAAVSQRLHTTQVQLKAYMFDPEAFTPRSDLMPATFPLLPQQVEIEIMKEPSTSPKPEPIDQIIEAAQIIEDDTGQ
jgi:hypothetical protein